jgi:enoyl-CoA hydratase
MTIRLPELIGMDRARRMSFTGDFIDAETAQRWGLVVEVVPHDALLDRAREIASTIAAIPAEYVRAVRNMYDEVSAMAGRDAWMAESRASRKWMEQRFDQSRLVKEREEIINRGRKQSGIKETGPA